MTHLRLVSTMKVVASVEARRSRLNVASRWATAGCKLLRSNGVVGVGTGAGVDELGGAGAGVFDDCLAPLVGVEAPTGVEIVGAVGGAEAGAGVGDADGYGLL